MLTRKSLLGLFTVAALVPACMGADMSHGTQTVEQLSARENSHHTTATAATAAGALRSETVAYVQDMHDMMDRLMAQCGEMMMGSSMMSSLRDMAGQMGAALDNHQSKMQAMTDLAAMRAECDEHHRIMGPMLDHMRDMMAGMMGGGMM